MQRRLRLSACLPLAAWLCLLQLACAFQTQPHTFNANARTRLQQPRQLRVPAAGSRRGSQSQVWYKRVTARPMQLQFQGQDQLAGVLSQEEKVRLEELAAIVPPPEMQTAEDSTWKRFSHSVWSSLFPSTVESRAGAEAEDTFIEQLQHTLLAAGTDIAELESAEQPKTAKQENVLPASWFRKVRTNSTLLEQLIAEAAELAVAHNGGLPELVNSPRARSWVRRVLERYDPLHPAYSRAFVDSNLALQEGLTPRMTPQSDSTLSTLASAPAALLNILRRTLPPVVAATAAMVAPTKQPVVRAAAAVLGALAGGRVAKRLLYARQQSAFLAVAEVVQRNQTITRELRELLRQQYSLSAEDLSVVLMATFGDELIRTVVDVAVVGPRQIEGLVQLSKQLCLTDMEVAHAAWKVAQLWRTLFADDGEIDFEFRNYPTAEDATDAEALHKLWGELAKEDELSRPTILWLGYHAQMLEALWKMKRASSIRGSNLLRQLSQRIGVQKLANTLVSVLHQRLEPELSESCERWILRRLNVAPEEIAKYQEQGDEKAQTYVLVLHDVLTSTDSEIEIREKLRQAQRRFNLPSHKLHALHAAAMTIAIEDIFQDGVVAVTAETGSHLKQLQAALDVSNEEFTEAYRKGAWRAFYEHCLDLVTPQLSPFEPELNTTAATFAKTCQKACVPAPVLRDLLVQVGTDVQDRSLQQSFGQFSRNPSPVLVYNALLFVGLGRERTQALAKACGMADLHIPVGDIYRYSAFFSELGYSKDIAGIIEWEGYITPKERRMLRYAREYLNVQDFNHFKVAEILETGLYDALRARIVSGRLNDSDKASWQAEYDKYVLDLSRVNDSACTLYGKELERSLTQPAPDEDFLRRLQRFLDISDEQAARLHEQKLGSAYKHQVAEILSAQGVVDAAAREQLAKLQSKLLLTNESASQLFNEAVKQKIEEAVDVLAYEYDTSTLSAEDFKEKYGETADISRFGIRGRVSFMAEAVKLTKMLRANNVPFVDTEGKLALPVSAAQHSFNHIKRELYKYYLLCVLAESDPALQKQYEDDKTLFALALGFSPEREEEMRRELLDYFTRRVLSLSVADYGTVGQQYFELIRSIQKTLAIPELEGNRLIRQLEIDLVRVWAGLAKKDRSLDTARHLRETIRDFGLDIVADAGIAEETRLFLYGREFQEAVEYGLPLNTLSAAQEAWRLDPDQAAAETRQIAQSKIGTLLSAAADSATTAEELFELAIRYADACPEPFEFSIASDRFGRLAPIYTRMLFGNKAAWMDSDPVKKQKLEKLHNLLKHAKPTVPARA